jgi:hypothetical protein
MQDKSKSKFLQVLDDEVEETEKELDVLRKLVALKRERNSLINEIFDPFDISNLTVMQRMKEKK